MIILFMAIALIAAPLAQATVWHGLPCDLTLVLTVTAGLLGGPLAGLCAGLIGGLVLGTAIGNLAAAMAVIHGALGILAGTARSGSMPRAALTALLLGVAQLALEWGLLHGGDGPHLAAEAVLLRLTVQTVLVMILTALLGLATRRRAAAVSW